MHKKNLFSREQLNFFVFNRNENRLYLFLLHFISSIVFIYLLNKSRRYSIFPMLVLIYRWNSIEYFSWLSSLTPLLYYSLLYLICSPYNCFLLIVHMIFYWYLHVKGARLAFLLSQSAFSNLVSVELFDF